jgi:NAD-dependent SIR2 family protein deacetylase
MESNQNDFTLFIKCPYCNGRKTEEKRSKIDSRTTSVEIIPCQHCSGYGQQVKKQHYLSHDIYTGKRDSDFYWDILKHKLPIPNYMYYGTKETCKACQGNGYIESKTEAERKTIITKNKCAECHGTGRKTIRTKKDLFGEVFKEYTLAKNKQRDSWNAIKNKAWESSEYAGYQEAHPWGYWEVCIR